MDNFETLVVIYDDGTEIVSWVGDVSPERDERFEFVRARLEREGWTLDSEITRTVDRASGESDLVHYATFKRPLADKNE